MNLNIAANSTQRQLELVFNDIPTPADLCANTTETDWIRFCLSLNPFCHIEETNLWYLLRNRSDCQREIDTRRAQTIYLSNSSAVRQAEGGWHSDGGFQHFSVYLKPDTNFGNWSWIALRPNLPKLPNWNDGTAT